MGATLSLAYRGSLDPDHILYDLLSDSSDTRQVRLKSRRPFVPAARNLLENLAKFSIRASEWTNYKWKAGYCENTSGLRVFVPGIRARFVEMDIPQVASVKLNRLVLGNSIRPCTDVVSLLHRISCVAPLKKPQTMF